MITRRDIAKLFGAGAVIVPVVSGKVDESAPATLIETPKIRPVEIFKEVPKPLNLRQQRIKRATVSFEMADGSNRSIRFDCVMPGRCTEIQPGEDVSAGLMFWVGSTSPQLDIARVQMHGGEVIA